MSVSASAASLAAAPAAAAGSSPALALVSSTRIAVRTAVSDASSGRGADDTPSDTTASATGPSGPSAVASAIASSLRECRRPRSVAPASSPRSSSAWSRPTGTLRPQDGQWPSGPAAASAEASSAEHTGQSRAPEESGAVDALIAAIRSCQPAPKRGRAVTGLHVLSWTPIVYPFARTLAYVRRPKGRYFSGRSRGAPVMDTERAEP